MDKRKSALCAIDIAMLAFSFSLLYFYNDRFQSAALEKDAPLSLLAVFGLCLAVDFVLRFSLKIYNHIWRYASAGLYLRLVLSDFITGVVLLLVGCLVPSLDLGLAASFFVMSFYCLLSLCSRLIYQFAYARRESNEVSHIKHRINVAIVGAGNIGSNLADELIRNPNSHYMPMFFIDKDQSKYGQKLNGLPVYPADDNIVEFIKSKPVQEILIALPDLPSSRKQELYEIYSKTGCKVKIYDYPLRDGTEIAKKRSLREIKIEDLLFRDSIEINDSISKEYYSNKTVLVTGGGGSIGSELCRQIAKLSPKKLIIFDIYENNAYDIQQELIRTYGDSLDLEVVIGSVRDARRLDDVFAQFRPHVVLHAAAHKHVPLMENSPTEAIKNNVFGTYNCANCAEKYGAEKFVLISTDKAVNPTNVMGASKRMCEMIVQARRDSNTKYVAVRFGNVLGSNGSVIPLFSRQIANGGPVTITDKRIIRYFMTIPEASKLVLRCGAIAKRGELFVLDMGKPVKIYDLAVKMIELAGYKPNEDIEIKEIGLRNGEKLYEELIIKGENIEKTDDNLIFIERDKPFSRDEIEDKLNVLRESLILSNPDAIKQALQITVPTFIDPDTVNKKAEESDEMRTVALNS